jgi:formylglycine-generating enzyme required for sulfatase activity
MHGNVWEWVWDRYGEYPKGPVVGYRGPSTGDRRVLRGGSFGYNARDLRSAYRFWDPPTNADETSGFGVCVVCRCPSLGPSTPADRHWSFERRSLSFG